MKIYSGQRKHEPLCSLIPLSSFPKMAPRIESPPFSLKLRHTNQAGARSKSCLNCSPLRFWYIQQRFPHMNKWRSTIAIHHKHSLSRIPWTRSVVNSLFNWDDAFPLEKSAINLITAKDFPLEAPNECHARWVLVFRIQKVLPTVTVPLSDT